MSDTPEAHVALDVTPPSIPSAARCFAAPDRTDKPQGEAGSATVIDAHAVVHGSRDLLAGVCDASACALGALLPAILCGEESAVHAFYNEGDRVDERLFADGKATLYRIAAEEELHDRMLRALGAVTPEPDDVEQRRRRAKRFFMRIQSRDLDEHFTRIAALDSGVCIIMGALVARGGRLDGAPVVRRMLKRIHSDEARHVAFSHNYAKAMGVARVSDLESFELVRSGLVELVRPCAPAFEQLGVDADRLFARLSGVRMPAP